MPIYTYCCQDCNHTFERFLRIANRKDPEQSPCPECSSSAVKQVINSNFERMAPDQLGRIRPHSDWRDHLNNIKRNNPGSDFTTW